jgi:hypothetical protein
MGDLHRRAGEIDKSLVSYNFAVDLYAKLDSPTFLYQARKGRLVSYIASGNVSAAREELENTLGLYEQYRGKIVEQSNRNSFFDAEQDVYDVAIDFEYSVIKDARKAFDYSEASRARSLLDLIRNGARVIDGDGDPDLVFSTVSHPLRLDEIQARLPGGVQLLQYAVLENRLLIWIISDLSFTTTERTIKGEELAGDVRDYMLEISRPGSNETRVRHLAMNLYDTLVGPVEPFLDRDKQIYIIPDKDTYSLTVRCPHLPVVGEVHG